MPYVNESQSSSTKPYQVGNVDGTKYTVTLPDGVQKSQYGYRSGTLSTEEAQEILGDSNQYAGKLSLIKSLDDEAFSPAAARRNRAWMVHDRDYNETRYRPTGTFMSYYATSYNNPTGTKMNCFGAFGINGLSTGFLPALAANSVLENQAAKLLRNSRPPEVGFDLARFAGEQREAPMLFKAANYMPRTKAELAGAYLNFMFGLKPTGSDLGKLAELVLRSDSAIQRLLDAEKIQEKSYRTAKLHESSGGGTHVFTTADTTPTGSSVTLGYNKTRYWFLNKYGATGNYGNVIFPVINWSYTRKQTLRTFATWEYFVPQPHEIRGRLADYRKKAEQVLALTKVSEATVYELTPWSWLMNWFADFGGLLRYQQAVVNNQIVATACGYSVYEEYTGFCHLTDYNLSSLAGNYPYGGVRDYRHLGVYSSIQYKRHKRLGANPYSIGPTWSLTNQQWAILGALGLARGSGQAIKR